MRRMRTRRRRQSLVQQSRVHRSEALESRLLLTIDIQFDFTTLGSGNFFTPERKKKSNEKNPSRA